MGQILLNGRFVCLVDDEFEPILANISWYKSSHGYAQGTIGSKKMLMHRFIMGAKDGDIIDHINGDKLDNRKKNLRFVTKGQNSQNIKKRTTTGFIGVCYDGCYIKANIKQDGKKYHIGMFPDLISAAKAYDAEAIRRFGPDALTNLRYFSELVLKLSEDEEKRD